MAAVLMNKNTPILEVTVEKGTITSFGKVLANDLMPVSLQDGFDLEKLNQWFGKRRIPEKREGLKQARLLAHGFDEDRNYFSLSDQYWVKQSPRDSWRKLNFFTNRYSQEIGNLFFEPWNADLTKIKEPSPDRTTNGVLRKKWVQDEEGNSWLIKAGSVIYHQEPLSEVLASIMLQKMDILPFVPYELVVEGMRFCSKCRNFVTADTEFVSASELFRRKPRKNGVSVYDHLLHMCEDYQIENAKEYLDRMIIVDHVLCNPDRHLGNFGFLRDANNGKILGFAPLFDCGSAYWGKSDEVYEVKSKLFEDCRIDILEEAGKKGLLQNAKTSREMKRLVSMYPEIGEKKKAAIKERMALNDLELERMAGEDRSKEKDVQTR